MRQTMRKLKEMAALKGVAVSELFMGKQTRQAIEVMGSDGRSGWYDTVKEAADHLVTLPDRTPERAAAALTGRNAGAELTVGVGQGKDGEPCLIVYLWRGRSKRGSEPFLPATIMGYPVEVKKVGRPRAQ